ncbi:MAG TPA: ABC transporter permease subunit/CPBP intramembrane protease, partial [Gemmataceae bacterium]|nr:ABC transporter permease subunit/CPBP intramembrane protease [Gemmataceae bacterium]
MSNIFHFDWSRVGRLAQKELREILRDRRTIVTLFLMPILLYPLLAIGLRQYFLLSVAPATTTQYILAIPQADEESIKEALKQGAPLGGTDPLAKVLVLTTDDPEQAVREKLADLGLRLQPGNDSDPRKRLGESSNIEIIVRDDAPVGLNVEELVVSRLTTANIRRLQGRLERQPARDSKLPFQTKVNLLTAEEGRKASILSTLVPLILVLMTITGGVYPAIDLTAGERERGTLEILMAAPLSRVGVLLAKYLAVWTVSMLTGIINLTMMVVTLLTSGLGPVVFGEHGLSLGNLLAVLGLLLLFALFFSALLLVVTSFARSFKEAQAYIIPLMLASIGPGMISLLPNMRLGGLLDITPLLNIVLLAKEIFEGAARFRDAAIVVLSTLFYAFAAITVAARIFGAEAVLYSDQGHWSDLFRRPKQERLAPTLSGALFCLALMFPASFVINGALAQLKFPNVEAQLLVTVPISLLLFVGIPYFSARMGNVNLLSGFQLRSASTVFWLGAALLGASLWLLDLELGAFMQKMHFTTIPAEMQERIKEVVEQWKSTSPVIVLLALAITPAFGEELFFRGYLFNALAVAGKPRNAVLATAFLFGVFHVLIGGSLALERIIPATLMGLVLGWLRWRSGSIWPGVVLHSLHNGLLLSAALFSGAFQRFGVLRADEEHVTPLALLIA